MMEGPDPSSFRDPTARVFAFSGRIFRAVAPQRAGEVREFLGSSLFKSWIDQRHIVGTSVSEAKIPEDRWLNLDFFPELILEHDRIDFISYPYEWPFSLLQQAALHHLSLQLEALQHDFSFSDSSAFNIQFQGGRPLLIDILSIKKYREGEYWAGYRQFCEQFLNPLLLTSLRGINFHPWYRGALEGIGTEEMAAILPSSAKLSWKTLTHVTLHAAMMRSARRSATLGHTPALLKNGRPLLKSGYVAMLKGLSTWIASMKPKGLDDTVWRDYSDQNSYDSVETVAKRAFIAEWVSSNRSRILWDVGCNTGEYSELALNSGAGTVIGFDFDHGALKGAVQRASQKRLNFLPLFLDVRNPAPRQGWRQLERMGLQERATADGVIALALLHHMVIGGNIPLDQAIGWIVGLAPIGVIEFVPYGDPMVDRMLANREFSPHGYDLEGVRSVLQRYAIISKEQQTTKSGRVLFSYRRVENAR